MLAGGQMKSMLSSVGLECAWNVGATTMKPVLLEWSGGVWAPGNEVRAATGSLNCAVA